MAGSNKNRGKIAPQGWFFQLPGVVNLVVKRQRHHWKLTLLALVGIVLAVGLVTNASFFAQAVDRVILMQELAEFSRITGRPPFSTAAYVFPSSRNPITVPDAEQLAEHVAGTLSGEVGLPVRHLGLEVSSGSMMLQPGPDSELYAGGQEFLGNVELVYVAGIAGHMEITEGAPFDEEGASGDVLDVWAHERLALPMGLHVGETLQIGVTLATPPIPVRLAGFWHARDPEAEFWFGDPDAALHTALLVRRRDYIHFAQPILPSRSRNVSWYIILDDSKITPGKSAAYLAGFRRGLDILNQYLPGVRLNTPPLDPLESSVGRSKTLTILLLSFNLPAFGILLYFLMLTSAIIAQWQRKETSILVSRGMTISGVLNLALLEQLLLSLIGCPLGIGFGMGIARLMGYTASFLTFTHRAPLPVSTEGLNFYLVILALALSLLARLWPAVDAARHSLVTEEREWARPTRIPFWYRYYLDFLLILPTWYAYDQLNKRGSLAGLIVDRPEDLYRDPLLIVVPTLFVLTAALLTMRFFPWVMRALDVLAHVTPWLTVHLALRQLGRRSQEYIRPLLLVIASLAMGVYTLSMAASLDQWLVDRMYYRTGADLVIAPLPFIEGEEYVGGDWIPDTASFLRLPGVVGATKVGIFPARVELSYREVRGRFLAINRLDFPSAAWFRRDFAAESLGGLMNRLALAQDGILVSKDFLARSTLRVGDRLSVGIEIDTTIYARSDFTIVGVYDYFPTVYEEDVAFIGNMDYLITLIGLMPSHNIWIRLAPGASGEAAIEALPGVARIRSGQVWDTRAIIATEQAKMERVGIFGTLSVGFLAATCMAILALVIYSYASLQERLYRFAVMHAIGLLRGQIIAQAVMEYTFLTLFGALTGAAIGMWTARTFVPFFRYTGERTAPLPPLLPIIAGQPVRNLVIAFALLVIPIEVATIVLSLYRQLATMLKRHWL